MPLKPDVLLVFINRFDEHHKITSSAVEKAISDESYLMGSSNYVLMYALRESLS